VAPKLIRTKGLISRLNAVYCSFTLKLWVNCLVWMCTLSSGVKSDVQDSLRQGLLLFVVYSYCILDKAFDGGLSGGNHLWCPGTWCFPGHLGFCLLEKVHLLLQHHYLGGRSGNLFIRV